MKKICVLFTLLMSFTLTMTKQISNIFNPGDTDELLNTLRGDIKNGDSWSVMAGEVIMYTTLTIYTVMFTVRYIKRVIYMAFFTMIAPLITLTYPLDKIKDGQAQAFTMWLREYVFTALIQVVHLVIYYVLVSSAIELVKNYTLYAILVIMFMKHAEDIVKKMFGFDKSETVGTLGAAVTGGLLMNAVNSMKRPPRPQGGAKEGGSGETGGNGKGVRTANTNPLDGLRNGQGGAEPGAPAPTEGVPVTAGFPGQQTAQNGGSSVQQPTQNSGSPTQINGIGQRTGALRRGLKGVRAVAGKYTRPVLGKAAGLMLGAAGTMIGFASGVAQGDIGKALTGAAGGAMAGYYGGQKGVNALGNAAHKVTHMNESFEGIADTWREGTLGTEEAGNIKFDREFMRSETYKALQGQPNFSEENVQEMLNAGITDKKAMEKILKNSNGDIRKAIGYYTLAKECPHDVYLDDNKLQKYLEDLGLSQTDATTMRNNMKAFR